MFLYMWCISVKYLYVLIYILYIYIYIMSNYWYTCTYIHIFILACSRLVKYKVCCANYFIGSCSDFLTIFMKSVSELCKWNRLSSFYWLISILGGGNLYWVSVHCTCVHVCACVHVWLCAVVHASDEKCRALINTRGRAAYTWSTDSLLALLERIV